MDLNELMAFLRERANEDRASADEERWTRGRVVLTFIGLAVDTPESFRPELRWLAGHYSGHPAWRELA